MANWTYPLRWPAGRAVTVHRQDAKFSHEGKAVSFSVAKQRLYAQLERLGADEVEISLNVRFTLAGKRDMNVSRTDPYQSGVAVYFLLNGEQVELACDKWTRFQDNMAAIAAHIDALRGQERWGVGNIKTAFSGHLALPAPEQWWMVLGLTSRASPADIREAWKAKVREADQAGDQNALARFNVARDAGLAANG